VLIDAEQLAPGTTLRADLCIIGGGAAGITLAMELIDSGLDVLLVESGSFKFESATQALYQGVIASPAAHEPIEQNRFRQFGGSTAQWGGRCVPFDPIDFDSRPFVPYSGWPIGYADVARYFAPATEICEAGPNAYCAHAGLPGGPREIFPGFDGGDFISTPLERWSPPTHFGKRYGKQLAASHNPRILLHGNCVRLAMSPDGQRVDHADLVTLSGRRATVSATRFIVACGGLESARLLLASNDVHRAGIGNHADKLGRFYMSHLSGTAAVAEWNAGTSKLVYGFEQDPAGIYCRRRFWVTPEAQRKHGMLNVIGYPFRADPEDPSHHSAVLSSMLLAKAARLALVGRRDELKALLAHPRFALRGHVGNILGGIGELAHDGPSLMTRRVLARRHLPYILPRRPAQKTWILYSSEHAPIPDSRVTLARETDALGMPRLRVDIRFSEADEQTVIQFHRLLAGHLKDRGLGRLVYDEQCLRSQVKEQVTHFNSRAHHLGTTRMSADPAAGVVDPDCRVHGVKNLYVASSSVFPTGGHANPTLTLLALTLRLAEHLKRV
jgi:choline dehydrogenase-like flavoprotein